VSIPTFIRTNCVDGFDLDEMSSIISFSYQPLMRGQTAPTAPALSSA
jgi:hypothetical protein